MLDIAWRMNCHLRGQGIIGEYQLTILKYFFERLSKRLIPISAL